jgi:hypothetical protein
MIELRINSDIDLSRSLVSESSAIVGLCKSGAIFCVHRLAILIRLWVDITYGFHMTREENPVVLLGLTADAFVRVGLGLECA